MPKLLVENTQPRIHNLGGHCTLMPGINEVEEAAWKEALKIELVRDLVRLGVLKPQAPAAPVAGAQGLAAMKVPEAIATVKKTVDKDLLEKWYADEQRKGVLEAIEEQLEEITPAKPQAPAAPVAGAQG
jgi:hypothetical protein